MKRLYKYKNNKGGFDKIKPKEIVIVWLDKNGYVHQVTEEPSNKSIVYIVELVKDIIAVYKEHFQSIKYVIQDNNDITNEIECKLTYNRYSKRYEETK